MQQALRNERGQGERPDTQATNWDEQRSSEFTKMLSMVNPSGKEQGTAPLRPSDKPEHYDWSTSLTLVQQTAEALRASAERVRKVEERAHAMIQRAAQELQNLHARNEALEARLKATEAREKQAEARAKQAEEWLRRIHNAIAEELPSSLSLLQSVTEPASREPDPA